MGELYIPGQAEEEVSTLLVIDDNGNELEIAAEDFWQYQADAMQYKSIDELEGGI